jgi:hypothetical protein
MVLLVMIIAAAAKAESRKRDKGRRVWSGEKERFFIVCFFGRGDILSPLRRAKKRRV